MARNVKCSYFLAGCFVWLMLFGCRKGCFRVLPAFIIVGGLFAVIAYFAYGKDLNIFLQGQLFSEHLKIYLLPKFKGRKEYRKASRRRAHCFNQNPQMFSAEQLLMVVVR